MKKLSSVQIKVIRLMQEGWELGRSLGGFTPQSFWLQKNGLGKGGETYRLLQFSTGYKLIDLGLIERTNPNINEFPTERYRLTTKGKELKL